jgi:hypothetical protein
MISKLDHEVKIISAISPYDFKSPLSAGPSCTLAHYPLIWGWATNKEAWSQLWVSRMESIDLIKVLKMICIRRLHISALSFFGAALLRIKYGKLKAWDAEMVFYFLLKEYKAIIPNKSLVINSGLDNVASNTLRIHESSDIANHPSNEKLIETLDKSTKSTKITDALIEDKIYNIKWFHALSVIKAFLFR